MKKGYFWQAETNTPFVSKGWIKTFDYVIKLTKSEEMDKQYFLDKLARNRPSVFETYNYDLLPATFYANDKIAIECYKHGVFEQAASNHLFSAGCPKCGIEKNGEKSRLTTEAFVEKSRAKFGLKFSYSKTVYTTKDGNLTITCPEHGDFTLPAVQHMWSRHGCLKCDYEVPRAFRKKKAIEDARKRHGDKYDYSKVVYANATDPVEIICPDHGSFWQNFSSHITAPVGCPKCSREADKLPFEEFVTRARKIHGDRYEYREETYSSFSAPITIICKKHGEFSQRAGSHIDGSRCRSCYVEDSWLPAEEFIAEAKRIHGDKYDYSKVKYRGSKRQVEIVCPAHGSFWVKPNSHTSSRSGCRFCQESKGEREVELVLKKYGIEFIREYRILPYLYRADFYLPEFNIYIEFNGIQHYTPVEMFGGQPAFEKVRENDELKEKLIAARSGFLIIITYRTLSSNSVEKEVLIGLRKAYRHWFVVNGQLRVFKSTSAACRGLGIRSVCRTEDLIAEAKRNIENFSVLF